jgi:DeoR family fructose operon transcriptional repressor
MAILKARKSITVHSLVKILYVSPATIRRDLEDMDKKGLLKRTRGGAILFSSSSEESSLMVREEAMKQEKKSIAFKCIDFLKNNESIFLDSSSTICNLVPYLNQFKYLTIITNGISTASLITQKTDLKVFMPSGYIQNQSNSILGETTSKILSKFHCDLFIFSCAGISKEFGLSEASIEHAEIKNLMMRNSNKRILLVDSSKFGKTYLAKSMDIKDIDIIITDKEPDEEMKEYILSLGIKLVY